MTSTQAALIKLKIISQFISRPSVIPPNFYDAYRLKINR